MKPYVALPVLHRCGGRDLAAMITRVHSDTCVNLIIFDDETIRRFNSCLYSRDPRDLTWHFPGDVVGADLCTECQPVCFECATGIVKRRDPGDDSVPVHVING